MVSPVNPVPTLRRLSSRIASHLGHTGFIIRPWELHPYTGLILRLHCIRHQIRWIHGESSTILSPILFFAKRSDLVRICPNHEPFKVQNMLMKLQ